MLRGIDISSWQGDIQIQNMPVDFIIIKATEGLDYTNPYCNTMVERCKTSGKLWGFYHFANSNDAVKEAEYFISQCKGYFGYGIPVLDWETTQNVEWVNRFVRKIHDETGVWPWIYANPWRFNQGGVEENCMRWVASYPGVASPTFTQAESWDAPSAEGYVGCWQFCSDGWVSGYDGDLDCNLYYGDAESWGLYCGRKTEPPAGKHEPIIVEDSKYRVEIVRKS